ncbi:MAG TPA: hypothetical protein ENG96_06790 [Gammaproteobacteria bacterium]|nr:hypothetical protein [Gammaproteobacteria bacterium]
MEDYFEGIDLDDAELIESLSRVTYELRENRKQLLEQHGAENELTLLDKITAGEVPEHPAYEHYLSAAILAATQIVIRDELSVVIQAAKMS